MKPRSTNIVTDRIETNESPAANGVLELQPPATLAQGGQAHKELKPNGTTNGNGAVGTSGTNGANGAGAHGESSSQPVIPTAPVSNEQKQKAFDLFRAGKSKGDVFRELGLTIYQVKNLKKTFNRYHPAQVWESPEDWVKSQDDVLAQEKVQEKAGNADVWLLIQALYSGGQPLMGILPFCGDPDQLVTDTMTRQKWFETVSGLVNKAGTLRDALEKRWGLIVKTYVMKDSIKESLENTPYGAFLLHRLNFRYVPNEAAFYRYYPQGKHQEKEGTWEFVSQAEVLRDILDWVVTKEIPKASLEISQVQSALNPMRPLGLFKTHNFSTNPLHVKNGMLFFEEEELVPVSPAYFSRVKLPVTYKKEAGTNPKLFLEFLDEAGFLPEDKELLQLWCGFVLLGNNSVHKIMLLIGDAGSGKSTLIDILERILGHESIATLNIERLDDRFELGSFYERRLLVAKDVSADALNSHAAHMLKALSGDTLIKAEIKHQNRRVSLKGPFNITITSNTDLYIQLHGDADAWQRRLLILKFIKKAGRKIIPDFADKIFNEESSKVLNWMIQGAIRARAILDKKNEFSQSAVQAERVNALLRLSDTIKAFVSEELQSDPLGAISTDTLYQKYENYCAGNRVLAVARGVFERNILLPIKVKWNGEKAMMKDPETGAPCRGYRGVSIKTLPATSPAPKTPTSATPAPEPPSKPAAAAPSPTAPPAAPAAAPATSSTISATATSEPAAKPSMDPVPTEPTPSNEVQF
jgi:P4 family phage/plasmid primase-like protien